MATQTKKVPQTEQDAQNIITVLEEEQLPAGVVTIPVGGTPFKVPGLKSAVQEVIDGYQKVETALTAYRDEVKALRGKLPAYRQLVTGSKKVLALVFAGNTKALTTLGALPKATVQRSAEEKAVIAAKAARTREQNAALKPQKQASGKVVLYDEVNGAATPASQATSGASNSASPTPPAGDVATGK
jgi:hypothetical protein